MKSTPSKGEPRSVDLAFEIRGLCCVKASDSFVAHALSVPRRDSSRRLGPLQPNTTKQTRSRRTPLESGPDCRSTNDRAAGGSPRSKRPKNTALVRTDTTIAHELIRGLCCVKASDSFVAHALSVPRRDSSRRPAQFGHPSSTNAPNTTKQTRSHRTPLESGADCRSTNDRAAGGSPRSKRPKNTALVRTDTTIAHGLVVRRCVSSGNMRSQATATERTKRTQSRRTAVKSTASNDEPRRADLAFEIRGLCSAPPQTDNAKPSVAHYRLPDAAGPADGTQLLRSRAREQAVSSEIPFGFLKEEVFSQTRERAVERRSRPPWMNTCVEREQREQGSRSSAPMAF